MTDSTPEPEPADVVALDPGPADDLRSFGATTRSDTTASDTTASDATPSDTTALDDTALDLDGIADDLDGVQAALARLADGTYWTDEVTGEPLSAELLDEHPLARRS